MVLFGMSLLLSNRVTNTLVIIYYTKMWNGLPTESVIEVCIGTGGSPKGEKHSPIVVTEYL
jgi:hypothetical protein